MRGLRLLIRLARNDADERRGELVRIAAAYRDAATALARHDRIGVEEAAVAVASPEARAAYATWLRRAARQRTGLELRRAQLERTETAAHEALRESVAALKRLETAARQAEEAARREAGRKAAKQADELYLLRRTA